MDDLISRQAAIDAIHGLRIMGVSEKERIYNQALENAEFVVLGLPSAQPPEPTLEQIEEYCRKRCLVIMTSELYNEMKSRWSSAQPEIIRCKDCKYSDENWRRVSVKWLPCMDMRTGSNWFCGSAERRTDERA